MTSPTRRQFLQSSSTAAASLSLASYVHAGNADARKTLQVALIGCGGRGSYLAGVFQSNPGVRLTWICDVDTRRLQNGQKLVRGTVKTSNDIRKVLADDTLDAVIVATPDHWHSPAAILACEAGKHVYVEKPCSHNVREGRLLVESARRNKRVVQHGTQVRSTTMMIDAVKLLHGGIIGDVKVCKAWNIQKRGNIGKGKPGTPPSTLDYDNWVGPAEFIPFQANRTPSGWHWWYHFGTGDMGNDGVHDIDYARWGLGVDFPIRVNSSGGRYHWNDDQQTPDTHQVSFEFPGNRAITWQGLSCNRHRSNFVTFYGDKGSLELDSDGGHTVYNGADKVVDKVAGKSRGDIEHIDNFTAAIRNDTPQKLNCEVAEGHKSTLLCHLGNIAQRTGQAITCRSADGHIVGNARASKLWERDYQDGWKPVV